MVQKTQGRFLVAQLCRTNPKQANTQGSSVSGRPDWPDKLILTLPRSNFKLQNKRKKKNIR